LSQQLCRQHPSTPVPKTPNAKSLAGLSLEALAQQPV